jgi:hypothetical protein
LQNIQELLLSELEGLQRGRSESIAFIEEGPVRVALGRALKKARTKGHP